MSRLYVVPTPIGNLEDVTLRALRILKEVDLILAEDTRQTSKLLKHYEIETRLSSYHAFNEHRSTQAAAERIEAGEQVALVSDAGTPSISDPGYLLVNACIERGLVVDCLPGPTALIPALVNSGLPSDRFVFEGFLPPKKGRNKRLLQIAEEKRTIVLYESPHRLIKTLHQLAEHLGEDRRASISRELSKMYEETRRGTLSALIEHFTSSPVKGEFVLVLHGRED